MDESYDSYILFKKSSIRAAHLAVACSYTDSVHTAEAVGSIIMGSTCPQAGLNVGRVRVGMCANLSTMANTLATARALELRYNEDIKDFAIGYIYEGSFRLPCLAEEIFGARF